MSMRMFTSYNHHLIKNEDLNHHGTLYAGRTMEWFVEAGFIAAAHWVAPENIVCRAVHGVTFASPVERGEIVEFISKIVLAGTTSLVAHVRMSASERSVVDGFITFIHVDANGKAMPHGITIEAENEQERDLQQKAMLLKK